MAARNSKSRANKTISRHSGFMTKTPSMLNSKRQKQRKVLSFVKKPK